MSGSDQVPDDITLLANDPDAEWRRMQQKTFTRWCNQHLMKRDLHIDKLETDLADGLNLVALIEMLSGRSVGRYNKTPKVHQHKLENVAIALKFLSEREGVKLVNIGNTDIVGGSLKLILGLIWTLILHYQVSMVGLDDGLSPRDALLQWLSKKLGKKINNFTKDWNDGTNIAHLVDAVGPGLFPDWAELPPEKALDNAGMAMDLAEDWLGVPQVIQPSDMVNPRVDEKSMMTYLSYFPKAELMAGAPLGPKLGGGVRVYGPAVDDDVDANAPSSFTIDATDARVRGDLELGFSGPSRPQTSAHARKNSPGVFDVDFEAMEPGDYFVDISFGGQPIPQSPVPIHVSRPPPDASKVRVTGPGIQRARVGEETPFKVDASNAGGSGLLEIGVNGPNIPPARVLVDHIGQFKFDVNYVLAEGGEAEVHVKWHGEPVPGSPFKVKASK